MAGYLEDLSVVHFIN